MDEPEMKPEMKPCPICAGVNIEEGIGCDEMYYDMDRCITCNSKFPVIRRNNRPIEDALQARIDELISLVHDAIHSKVDDIQIKRLHKELTTIEQSLKEQL